MKKKICVLDQNKYIPEFVAGELDLVSRMRLRLHHMNCASCRTEWTAVTQLQNALHQAATVEPPPSLRARIWDQLPELPVLETTRTTEQTRVRPLRWMPAGIAAMIVLCASGVTAQLLLNPLQKQYAIMHEDADLSRSLFPTDGSSGITGRLDGLYGNDGVTGMRWRVLGRVKVRVVSVNSGQLLAGGETGTLTDQEHSRLAPKTYSYILGLNPIADPSTLPTLTVNEKGRVAHLSGYGKFTVFDKWQFIIDPLPTQP